jgi:hypothetical protein
VQNSALLGTTTWNHAANKVVKLKLNVVSSTFGRKRFRLCIAPLDTRTGQERPKLLATSAPILAVSNTTAHAAARRRALSALGSKRLGEAGVGGHTWWLRGGRSCPGAREEGPPSPRRAARRGRRAARGQRPR